MNKYTFIAIIILLCVCSMLSVSLAVIKFDNGDSTVVSNDSNQENENDFDSLNYLNSFDVSDFTGEEENTIDIVSKKYKKNTVTVLDSDFVISDELLNELNDLISNYGVKCSFYIVSLDDGMSVAYNIDDAFETASSIKAPYALYIYEEIAKGNIDPSQEISYEEKYYNKGTGIIKNSDFGTSYTVSDLLYYSLTESDNVAHTMLHSTFGVKGYNKMLKNLGTKQLYLTASSPWGFTSARSSAIIWQEIYNFAIREPEGITLLNILCNGKYNYYKEIIPSIPSASKTGFATKDVLETGIVFGEHPYIAIAIANKGGNVGAYTQVLKLLSKMNDIMNEYDEYLKNDKS